MVSLNSYVFRNDKLVWRIIDNEAVIMDPKNSMLHSLNRVGTRIWDLSDGTKTIEEIVQEIYFQFEVTSETARKDVLNFVSELADKEMLTLATLILLHLDTDYQKFSKGYILTKILDIF